MTRKNQERDQLIVTAYREGYTLSQIGHDHGITRERVRQIVKLAGLTRKDGGAAVRNVISPCRG